VFLFAGLIVQCLAWFWLLRSYRQLNTAKYAVVGVLEERLPASPCHDWDAARHPDLPVGCSWRHHDRGNFFRCGNSVQ
jgi:hypothetical protein